MKNDTMKAWGILEEKGYTCVVCGGEDVYTATERGVKPLLNWLDSGMELKGFCAADKVVGRATAFLYSLLGVEEVYAHVMSRPAAEVLKNYGISAHAGQLTDGIINRKGTGPCPFEAAVMGIQDSRDALTAIREKMRSM